jgi:hypothetical protein
MEECVMKKKQTFQRISEDEVKIAYDYHKDTNWTFFNEREHTETTFHNRFNFLLMAYSLLINAYFSVDDINNKLIILFIGLIIVIFLFVGIYGAYTRFKICYAILRCLDDKNALSIVMKEYEGKLICKIFPRNAIAGYIVPSIMSLSLVIGIVYNICKLRSCG